VRILVTGGAGFVGSAVVRRAVAEGLGVVNVDKLTYAANLDNLALVADSALYAFEQADICDAAAMARIFAAHDCDAVMHLAAESHVDRSIDAPGSFIQTNIVGTYTLLEAARAHWRGLPEPRKAAFRFHHVSTDEVFGALGPEGMFDENTPYVPNSPYSASKAASDHLVRAWGKTYGLPVVVTNCSNNYGPFQFPEKLIPMTILNALAGLPIPVYGCGENVRDWLYVEDHAAALLRVLTSGRIGQTYTIGGANEARNIDIVRRVCAILDEMRPTDAPRERLVSFVADRPGHDFRYAIDASKIEADLGWSPSVTLEKGLRRTVEWHLANERWLGATHARLSANARLGITI